MTALETATQISVTAQRLVGEVADLGAQRDAFANQVQVGLHDLDAAHARIAELESAAPAPPRAGYAALMKTKEGHADIDGTSGAMSVQCLESLERFGAGVCYEIGQDKFDPNQSGTISSTEEAKLRNHLRAQIPDPAYSGMVMLDFEAPEVVNAFRTGPSHALYSRITSTWRRLIAITRDELPNAKIGPYALPPVWGHRPESEDEAIFHPDSMAIYDLFDWWSARLYLLDDQWDIRATHMTNAILRTISRANGKPLWAAVTPRLSNPTKQLLTEQQWLDCQIRPAVDNGCAGIHLWSADRYFAKLGQMAAAQPAEFGGMTLPQQLTRIDDVMWRMSMLAMIETGTI